MSHLLFDGDENSLRLFDKDNKQIGGPWRATNRPDSTATLRRIPDGEYKFKDQRTPHLHGQEIDKKTKRKLDSPNGSYGTNGILRLSDVTIDGIRHQDLGIHAGQSAIPDRTTLHGRGPLHATHGCVRTTEEAMRTIRSTIHKDSLSILIIRNNGKTSK